MPRSIAARSPTRAGRFAGCLLGGAVGDALGAPVEFWSLATIRATCGPGGVREYLPTYGRTGAITDDTQMTLFTAEGLTLAARHAGGAPSVEACTESVYDAYRRWLRTQEGGPGPVIAEGSGLLGLSELHSRRAPGNTCLSALQTGRMGTVERPLNDSKGCGGVMRAAPAGLAGVEPFRLGCDLAAITHGHPSGYLSAGFLAAVIAELVDGADLAPAVGAARAHLTAWPGHEECLAAVDRAVALAQGAPRASETVERLGGGWTGEEALAIALFCALTAASFEDAVSLAVTHGGDSDSTGSITGNILGALWGVAAIPPRWLDGLELREASERVARELDAAFPAAHAARPTGG